tara:strand:- start:459 stop:719 length:261 start_codon:yes stop_codon:yes gene_type:complete
MTKKLSVTLAVFVQDRTVPLHVAVEVDQVHDDMQGWRQAMPEDLLVALRKRAGEILSRGLVVEKSLYLPEMIQGVKVLNPFHEETV